MTVKTPTQLSRVRDFVGVHGPVGFTLAGLALTLGISQTAASARLRDLRAEGYDVKVDTKRDLNGKQQVTYKTSQHAVNLPRSTVKAVAPAPKDVSREALVKVATDALAAEGSSLCGGRVTVVNAIAKYLAA